MGMKIKQIPKEERPREKMLSSGRELLTNQELLAILVGSGTKKESSMAVAAKILGIDEKGIRFLASAGPEDFLRISGVGQAVACRIAAAVELSKRIAVAPAPEKICLTAPEDIANMFMEDMRHLYQEQFRILMLNAKGESMGRELITIGSLTQSLADSRDVFRPAVRKGAASIILVHNHPSGNPTPSELDVSVTKQLIEAGVVLGIRVLDHIVIGDGNFISMKQRKLV